LTKRPTDLIYAVDETPPLARLALLGAQHAALLAVYLVLIVIVAKTGGASHAETVSAVSLGMIASAIGTVLQALHRGPVGSGFLAAPVFSAIYLGPSMLAAGAYGLPAVYGMTKFAGLVEIIISRFLTRLRLFFPPAISGFIVMIVGIQLGLVGIDHLLNIEEFGSPHYFGHIIVAVLTLATIIGLSIWSGGMARLLCSTIGILAGFILSFPAGLLTVDQLSEAVSGPLLRFPDLGHLSYSFEWSLVPAFLIAGIAASLRVVGVITTCQKINDDDWNRPDLESIRGGMLADGLGCMIGGLLGTIGQNTGPSLVGVSKASGATSRSIAFSAGVVMAVFAFFPVIGTIFILMPKAVIGAALVFTASFMISGGIQIMVSRNIDTRMTYVIGIALLLGLGREVYSDFFKSLPNYLQPFTSTALALAVTASLLLHLIFRVGTRKTVSVHSTDARSNPDDLIEQLRERALEMGLAPSLLERSIASTAQVLEHLHETKLVRSGLTTTLSYNEIDLVVAIEYKGILLSLPNVGVRHHVLVEEEAFSYGLADFLTGVYPDRMESRAKGDMVSIRLVFPV
jgi:NCS2 family nucleobase:cation symporter-2